MVDIDKIERAAFEADAEPMGFDLTRQSIAVPEPWAQYVDPATGHRWAGWLAATEIERERCARVCESIALEHSYGSFWQPSRSKAADECAEAIRKGETP